MRDILWKHRPICVKIIDSGRISLDCYVMHFYVHLIKKNIMVNLVN